MEVQRGGRSTAEQSCGVAKAWRSGHWGPEAMVERRGRAQEGHGGHLKGKADDPGRACALGKATVIAVVIRAGKADRATARRDPWLWGGASRRWGCRCSWSVGPAGLGWPTGQRVAVL